MPRAYDIEGAYERWRQYILNIANQSVMFHVLYETMALHGEQES